MYGDQHAFPAPVDLVTVCPEPVRVDRLEMIERHGSLFVLAHADASTGTFKLNRRAEAMAPFIRDQVLPVFAERDAREVAQAVRDAYRKLYKWNGIPLWSGIASVEMAILDLLGRAVQKPVRALLGGTPVDAVAYYLSFMRRDTEPEAELEHIAARIAETGARAIKLKIGGRMGAHEGPIAGRSEALIRNARKVLGDGVVLYADANGSYSADQAIEKGQMMEDHGFAMLEEPCPFEEYDETRRVTKALDIDVSAGEQETNLAHLRRMIEQRFVDVVQPDLMYVGGVMRTLAVARWAAAAGRPAVPHSPRADGELAAVLHVATAMPNLHGFIEVPGHFEPPPWLEPHYEFRPDGTLAIPPGPGWGMRFDL